MEQICERTDLLPPGIPLAVLVAMALAAVGLWFAARRFSSRHASVIPFWAVVVARVIAATIALWTIFQALARDIDFACRWPLWAYAFIGGAAIEAASFAYRHEQGAVPPRTARALPILRCTVIALALLLLLQPQVAHTVTRHIVRKVAVLVDDSDSMRFPDELWTASEKLALATHFGIGDSNDQPLAAIAPYRDWRDSFRREFHPLAPTNQLPKELTRSIRECASALRELQGQNDALLKACEGGNEVLSNLQRLLRDEAVPACDGLLKASRAKSAGEQDFTRLANSLEALDKLLPVARETACDLFWDKLPEVRRAEIDACCVTQRLAIAESLLLSAPRRTFSIGQKPLLDALASRYDVAVYRMGAGIVRISESAATNIAEIVDGGLHDTTNDVHCAATDFAAALEQVTREIPSDQLAGVLMLTDGRHNGIAALDPIARLLGLQEAPISTILVGGSRIPCDLSLADVSVPESVYLGDNVRARAVVRATRANGRKISVRLKLGDEVVDESELQVNSDDWRREVRLSHMPTNLVGLAGSGDASVAATNGTDAVADSAVAAVVDNEEAISYRLEVAFADDAADGAGEQSQEGDDGGRELFDDNNQWDFDVAVSDDRTAVLLVDSRPRWEFRYLRNLFYGRDKSIHLQYLLTEPDTIGGVTLEEPLPPASASRPFGEAEAGALPADTGEWRKFDVIILGDVDESVVTPEVVASIRECVAERGALLVVIAGPRSMPHAFGNAGFADLLPVTWTPTADAAWVPPEESYHVTLTPAGRFHAVMQQAASVIESESVWDGLQEMRWRFQGQGVKPDAEVLAFATASGAPDDFSDITAEDVAERLDAEKARRSRDALIVARNYGRGKVLMMNFDQTWRMRYLAGDRLHHRFWGQVVRWGIGEKLRAGDAGLRVGTDRLTYSPGDAPQVFGRITDEGFQPVNDAHPVARLFAPDGTLVHETPLTLREDAQGIYEGSFPQLATNGVYKVELRRDDSEGAQSVRTLLMSVSASRPAERAEVSASREAPGLLARWTGGKVVDPSEAASMADAFGEGRRDIEETISEPLWNHPAWFILLLLLLATEWILRKRAGLA